MTHIRYFGDNKTPGRRPEVEEGNIFNRGDLLNTAFGGRLRELKLSSRLKSQVLETVFEVLERGLWFKTIGYGDASVDASLLEDVQAFRAACVAATDSLEKARHELRRRKVAARRWGLAFAGVFFLLFVAAREWKHYVETKDLRRALEDATEPK